MFERFQTFLQRCVSIDLEVNPATASVFAFAAVRSDGSPAIVGRKGYTSAALDRLERELSDAPYLLGHNIIRHDLPHLVALRPRLARLFGSPIDTLWLNPLAFPRNPYHHLVKHYHDGRLQAGHINDPELDARLVFEVLHDQLGALQQQHSDRPDVILAYHYLTTRMENAAGFDSVFREVRGAPVPGQAEAREAIARLLTGQACQSALGQVLDRACEPAAWLANGLCALVDPRRGRRFRDAALGEDAVSRSGPDRPAVAGCRLQPPRLRVVPGTERSHPGAVPLVRLRWISAATGR